MYDQIRENPLYIMLYAVVIAMAMIASCYLLFRRGNAFAPDITPPLRLRRWTAAFFAVFVVNHVWYMGPAFFLTSNDDVQLANLVGGLLDCMTFFPLAIVVLLTMLQDRRRPLWPVAVIVAPLVVGMAWSVATRSGALVPVVLAIIVLMFAIYALNGGDLAYEYILQLVVIVLICYLLWRVETLSDLSLLHPQGLPADETATEVIEGDSLLPTIRDNIGALLQQHCIDKQLYLQHDLTVAQLAQAIGVNRLYLSQYFSRQGLSYNAYINDLRINHFVSLYLESLATQRPFTAKQLAHDSGYQSYSTFSLAFKQRMRQSVTAWMRNVDK